MLPYRAYKWTIQDLITQVIAIVIEIIILIIIIVDTTIAHCNIGTWSNAHTQKWNLYRTKVILPTAL